MLKIVCSALMLSHCLSLHAQSLAISDTIPDITLNHLISYPQKTARLKDFNKHFLILDFWNIFCGSCIEAFPFLEKMEKQFSGKLQVLLVNYESEETVKKFFEKRKLAGYYTSSDPAVCSDSLLSGLFIHSFNPHYVWINDKGVVYAITGLQEMTEENIDAFIRGQPSVMAQKTDTRLPYDYEKPLFINGNGGSGESILYYSILSGYVDKLSHLSAVICDSSQGYFITVTDQDIRSLYALAYDKGEFDKGRGVQGVPRNLTVFEVTDTSKYYGTIHGRYAPENCYCYDLRVPKARDFNELKLLMQADLNRYFHLQAYFEKRKIPCWVL
jgi:thiol-disulfide isomerase/thioredoxin